MQIKVGLHGSYAIKVNSVTLLGHQLSKKKTHTKKPKLVGFKYCIDCAIKSTYSWTVSIRQAFHVL